MNLPTPSIEDARRAFAPVIAAFDAVSVFSISVPGLDPITIERRGKWWVVTAVGNRVAESSGRMVADPLPSNRSAAHLLVTRHTFTKALLVARRVVACYPGCGIATDRLDALDRVAWMIAGDPPPDREAAEARAGG